MKPSNFFGGTAYLGIPYNDNFRQLVIEGMDRYGTNFGASRNNNVKLDIFEEAESAAARRCLAEDAIIVSSGYLAAQLVIQSFLPDHELIYAPDTHPALWIGQPAPPKMNFTEWSDAVLQKVSKSSRPILLVTNSLNNLLPEIYNFDWLLDLKPGKQVTLLVDDSHGLGITGVKGQGVYSRIPASADVDVIVVSSMAKALGVDAGVILGKKKLMDQLRQSPIYAGASPPSPGMLYAYLHSETIYLGELDKLRENMKFFNAFPKAAETLTYLTDFPVYVINDEQLTSHLSAKGITISSFAYPDPNGKLLNRIVLNSEHSKSEIRNLAQELVK